MADFTLDCKGMVCPLPIAEVQKKTKDMKPGQTLEVIADCSTFSSDIEDWCKKTNRPLLSKNTSGNTTTAVIKF